MAKKPENGNYLTLEDVRISYDRKNDSIHLTSKDPELSNGFNLTLNGGRKAENALRELLERHGFLAQNPENNLPNFLDAKERPSSSKWNLIPLGKSDSGTLFWNTSLHPNALTVGVAGSGKTVLIDGMIEHCSKHKDKWEVHAFDISGIAFARLFKENPGSFDVISTTLVDADTHIKYLRTEMKKRYAILESLESGRFEDIKEPPKSLMVVLDNAALLLDSKSYSGKYDQEEFFFRQSISSVLGEILESGSKVGIHVAISLQAVRGEILPVADRSFISARFVLGRQNELASVMALGNNSGHTKIRHGIKGRGLAQFDGVEIPFQAYSS